MKHPPKRLQEVLLFGSLLLTAAGVHADEPDDLDELAAEVIPAATSSKPEAPAPSPAVEEQGGQLKEARAHFDRGVEYYAEGDFRAALVELTRAYTLQPTYKMLYNLGQVAFELRDYAGAEQYYRAYLTEGGDEIPAERTSEVKEELARLRSRVASLRIQLSLKGAEVRVDDKVISRAESVPVRVSAGQRRIVAEKSGYAPVSRVVDVSGGDELNVRLDFGPPLTAASSADSGSSPAPLILGIGAAVLGAAAGGVGYWAYVDTAARNDQLGQYTTRAELDRLSSQAHTKALLADVLLGTAVTAALVGTIILLTSSGSESPSKPARATQRPARAAY